MCKLDCFRVAGRSWEGYWLELPHILVVERSCIHLPLVLLLQLIATARQIKGSICRLRCRLAPSLSRGEGQPSCQFTRLPIYITTYSKYLKQVMGLRLSQYRHWVGQHAMYSLSLAYL